MAKEDFKAFVKSHPHLISYVKNGEMTWQGFYEIYDLYGDDTKAWDPYLKDDKKDVKSNNIDIMGYLKNIDLDAVQESINSIQRVLGVVSDLTIGSAASNNNESYEARPIYQHLDD